jgi:tRNA threonylcarbamoyladenosine biosynthesis protein TsaB
MRILAFDTSTLYGSAALADDGEIVGEIRFLAKSSHSTLILPAIERLLAMAGVAPAELDAIAAVVGPGSFTGLRVGISTAQGLALGANLPCLGITAFDALAARIRGTAPELVAMVDAYRGEVYVASYDAHGSRLTPPVTVSPLDYLRDRPVQVAIIGDGALRHAAEIHSAYPQAHLTRRSLYLAGVVACLAGAKLAAGEGQPAETLQPYYIREAEYRKAAGK